MWLALAKDVLDVGFTETVKCAAAGAVTSLASQRLHEMAGRKQKSVR